LRNAVDSPRAGGAARDKAFGGIKNRQLPLTNASNSKIHSLIAAYGMQWLRRRLSFAWDVA